MHVHPHACNHTIRYKHPPEIIVTDAAARIAERDGLGEDDRATLVLAALCHDLGKPETTFRDEDGRIRVHDEMEARFVLWQATKDQAQLDRANELHKLCLDNAPEDCRAAMLKLPLHAAIEEAVCL